MHFGFGAPKLTQLARRIFVCKDTREEFFFLQWEENSKTIFTVIFYLALVD